MAGIQQMLAALPDMQQNAQANVPATLNNGNPQGANNMPSQLPPIATGGGNEYFYPWMQPSSHMDMIQQMLQGNMYNNINPVQAQQPPVQQPPPATMPPVFNNTIHPIVAGGVSPAPPVLPQSGGSFSSSSAYNHISPILPNREIPLPKLPTRLY